MHHGFRNIYCNFVDFTSFLLPFQVSCFWLSLFFSLFRVLANVPSTKTLVENLLSFNGCCCRWLISGRLYSSLLLGRIRLLPLFIFLCGGIFSTDRVGGKRRCHCLLGWNWNELDVIQYPARAAWWLASSCSTMNLWSSPSLWRARAKKAWRL